VVVHTYFGALDEKTYAHLMDADVEALGFDLVAGDRDETLSNITEFGTKDAACLGIADGQNTLGRIRRHAQRARRLVPRPGAGPRVRPSI